MKYLRAVGRLGCLRGELDAAMKALAGEPDEATRHAAAGRALAIRVEMARAWEQMMTLQLAATDTVGEMGTIANLEQHVRRSAAGDGRRFLEAHDETLADALGSELPESIRPTNRYRGEPRLIVPTVRPDVDRGEQLDLKVIVLDNQRPRDAVIHWRTLGNGPFNSIKLSHVGRGVHSVVLPPAEESTIEYYIEATTAGGRTLRWPATAPKLNQSVVVMP